jgi:protein-S-isoprenylcysteine O-methyltransferase Ste14
VQHGRGDHGPGLARHLVAIVALPGIVLVVVPALLLAGEDVEVDLDVLSVAGGVLLVAGLALWTVSVVLFARIGRGTLAPWDATKRLVVVGPYRHVRNPMISGVLAMLAGEAALFGSLRILVWTGVFFVLNAVWFRLVEEPGMRARFGEEYDEYARRTPRWIPRLGRGPHRARDGS